MIGWSYKIAAPWTVSIAGGGALTNQRSANITGQPNPWQNPGWWLHAVVSMQVGPLNGPTFSGARIYGSHSPLGFPPPGQAADAILIMPALGGPNQGLFRTLRTRTVSLGAGEEQTSPLVGIPPYLLLEYDVAAGGAGISTMFVSVTFYGPEMTGLG